MVLYVDSSIIERDGSLGLLLQFCTYVSRRAQSAASQNEEAIVIVRLVSLLRKKNC